MSLFDAFKKGGPLSLRRGLYGRGSGERLKKKQKNGNAKEVYVLLSLLINYARRHKYKIVYPGALGEGSEATNLLAFVVTRSEILGFNCFGYSGVVEEKSGGWVQEMNGEKKRLTPDPDEVGKEQYALGRKALNVGGLQAIPFRVLSVFTNRYIVLKTLADTKDVYDMDGVKKALAEIAEKEAAVFTPEAVETMLLPLLTKKKEE